MAVKKTKTASKTASLNVGRKAPTGSKKTKRAKKTKA